MNKIYFYFVIFIIFLIGCVNSMKQNQEEIKTKISENITIGDSLYNVKRFFVENNIEFKLRSKNESKDFEIYKNMQENDKVLMAYYAKIKDMLSITYYDVNIIFSENNQVREVIFLKNYSGP